jgi:hypothetical protein
MRTLAVALLIASAGSLASAADKDEDKAKEATIAFLKAVKAKDIDALMKTVDVPFLMTVERKPKVFEKADELKTELKATLDKIKDGSKIPAEAGEVLDLPAVRKKIEGKKDKEVLELVEKVLGANGYVVMLGKDGKEGGAVLVRIKDGKAVVVGLPR